MTFKIDAKKLRKIFLQYWDLTALAFVLLFGALSVRTIFRPGILPGWDNPEHLVCSYFTAKYFYPNILGWDPYNNFGWVFNQYYNPGAYILVATIHNLFLGTIDINTAYKLGFLLTYLLPGFAAYWLVKSLSGNRLGAVLAAFLCIVVMPQESEWFDAGLKQMYIVGMWPQRLGIGLALLALALMTYTIRSKGLRWSLLLSATASLTAFTLLSHPMMGIGLALLLVLFGLNFSLRNLYASFIETRKLFQKIAEKLRPLYTLILVGSLALGFTAFWTIPLLETNTTYHSLPTITWRTGPWAFMEVFGSLDPLLITLLSLGVVISTISAETQQDKVLAIILAASGILMVLLCLASPYDGYMGMRLIYASLTFFLAALIVPEHAPLLLASGAFALIFLATGPETYTFQLLWLKVDLTKIIPFSKSLGFSKFAGLARYLMLTISALGFAIPLEKIYTNIKGLKGGTAQISYLLLGLSILILLNFYATPHIQLTDFNYPISELHLKLDEDFPGTVYLQKVIAWVGSNTTDNTYIFYQDTLTKLGDWNNLPVSHYFYLSSWITRKPQVGAGFGTRYITHPLANTESDLLFGQPIGWYEAHPEKLYKILEELGISYLVVFDPRLIVAMKMRRDLFKLQTRIGQFYIFKTKKEFNIVTIEDGKIEQVTFEPNKITIKYTANKDTTIKIRQVKYPGWTARLDASKAEIEEYYPDIPSIIAVMGGVVMNYKVPFMQIKAPAGSHTIILEYNRITIGNTIFLCTLIVTILLNIIMYYNAKRREKERKQSQKE